MPLNRIVDNVISQIMKSLLGSFSKSDQLGNLLVHWETEFSLLSFTDWGQIWFGPK
jgi:hypothetical protein